MNLPICFERNLVRATHIPARETHGLGKRLIRRRNTIDRVPQTIRGDSSREQNSLEHPVLADGGMI